MTIARIKPLPDVALPWSNTTTGHPATPFAEYMQSIDRLLRLLNLGFASFVASKNGGAAQVVAAGAADVITLPVEDFDTGGGFFDVATSRYTPRAGLVLMLGRVRNTDGVAGDVMTLRILKNGVTVLNGTPLSVANVFHAAGADAIDQANGTDYYELVFFNGAAAPRTISTPRSNTWFAGISLGLS